MIDVILIDQAADKPRYQTLPSVRANTRPFYSMRQPLRHAKISIGLHSLTVIVVREPANMCLQSLVCYRGFHAVDLRRDGDKLIYAMFGVAQTVDSWDKVKEWGVVVTATNSMTSQTRRKKNYDVIMAIHVTASMDDATYCRYKL